MPARTARPRHFPIGIGGVCRDWENIFFPVNSRGKIADCGRNACNLLKWNLLACWAPVQNSETGHPYPSNCASERSEAPGELCRITLALASNYNIINNLTDPEGHFDRAV
jgi:hypothetical protein